MRGKDMSYTQRVMILTEISSNMQNGSLPRGFQTQLGYKYGVAKSTVSRLIDSLAAADGDIEKAAHNNRKNCGRKEKYHAKDVIAKINAVPLEDRTSQEKLAAAIGMSLHAVRKVLKDAKLRTYALHAKN
jgi:hypothetical protein